MAEDVWRKIQQALAEPPDAPDAPMDEPERYDMAVSTPWPLTVTLLLANGNFLRPVVIPLERGGEEKLARGVTVALAKWAAFLAAWAGAAWLLPAWIVGLAFVIWAAAATPGIVAFHRDFQNEPSGEPEVHSRLGA